MPGGAGQAGGEPLTAQEAGGATWNFPEGAGAGAGPASSKTDANGPYWKFADCARICFVQTRPAGAPLHPPLGFAPFQRHTETHSYMHTHAHARASRLCVRPRTHLAWTAGWLSGGCVRTARSRRQPRERAAEGRGGGGRGRWRATPDQVTPVIPEGLTSTPRGGRTG